MPHKLLVNRIVDAVDLEDTVYLDLQNVVHRVSSNTFQKTSTEAEGKMSLLKRLYSCLQSRERVTHCGIPASSNLDDTSVKSLILQSAKYQSDWWTGWGVSSVLLGSIFLWRYLQTKLDT